MLSPTAETPAIRDFADNGRPEFEMLGGSLISEYATSPKFQADLSFVALGVFDAANLKPSQLKNSNALASGRDLRPYQIETVRLTYAEIRAGNRRVVLMLPTGAGKTRIAGEIIHHALARGKRVAFVVPFISLIDQTVLSLGRDGILDIGVVQASHSLWRPDAPVQVCSMQTLERRGLRPDVDVVIIDECHRRNGHMLRWMGEVEVPFIGLSATPWTVGMGKHWNVLVTPVTMLELIEQGHLIQFRVFASSTPDLSGVRTRCGADGEVDYVEAELSRAMSDPTLVGDVVTTWCARGEGRPTIIFAVDRGHAHVLRSQFQNAGVPTGYVDAKTPRLERNELAKRLAAGDIKVIVNIDCLTAGFDCPEVACIVLARPTRSAIRYVQSVGRGLRPAPGKVDCLILDHSDTTATLGFVTDIGVDGLDDGEKSKKSAERKSDQALPKKCPSCSFLKPPKLSTCPACGFTLESRRVIECVEGDLVEITAGKSAKKHKFAWLSDAELYGQLQYHAASHGYKRGWATAKFKALRGHWPPRYIAPHRVAAPALELASWIRSENIRFAKSKAGGRHAS